MVKPGFWVALNPDSVLFPLVPIELADWANEHCLPGTNTWRYWRHMIILESIYKSSKEREYLGV